jgi:hypothetical protein
MFREAEVNQHLRGIIRGGEKGIKRRENERRMRRERDGITITATLR